MNKKGTGLAWETVVSWGIKITAVAIVLFVIFGGPKALFAKSKELINEVFGEKIKAPGLSGGNPSIPDEFRKSYDSIKTAFNKAKNTQDSNCFIEYTPAQDMKGNKILVEEDNSVKGANIVFANSNMQRISSDDSVIAGIKPCVVAGSGTVNFFNYWLMGGNANIAGFNKGNIDVLGGNIKMGAKEFKLSQNGNLLYKTSDGGLCFLPFSDDNFCAIYKEEIFGGCAVFIKNKARLCDEKVTESSFSCKRTVSNVPYFFREGEYYCEPTHDSLSGYNSQTYECKNGLWQKVDIKSSGTWGWYKCTNSKEDLAPYNKNDKCCCKKDEPGKCIKNNPDCGKIGFIVTDCPENIGKRRPIQGG